MLYNEHLPFHHIIPNMVRITLWMNLQGHTYMETDSEGGKVVKVGRKVLNDIRMKGAMHVSIPEPNKDPEYAVSWHEIAVSQGLDVISLT